MPAPRSPRPRRPPGRGGLHASRHRGGPPRPARAAPRRRAPGGDPRAHRGRALGGPARGPAGRGAPAGVVPVDRPGRVRLDAPSTVESAVRGRLPARQPRGRHAPAGRRTGGARGRRTRLHGRLCVGGPAAPAGGLGGAARRRRTSGVARRRRRAASCAGAPGGANPSPPTSGVRPASQRLRERPAALAAAAALQAVVADGSRTARQHALIDRVRRVAGALPDVEVVGDPSDRLPHLVNVLVPLRRRRGPGHRARPAGLRGGQRVGLHVLDARAQPRAGGDGRAHPRQRRVSLGRDTTETRRRGSWPCARGGRAGRGREVTALDALELDCRGLVCPAPVIELARRRARGRGRRPAAVVTADAAARVDVPAWCRMTRSGVRRRGGRRRRRAALRRTPGQLRPRPVVRRGATRRQPRRRTTSATALDELACGEGVLLGADRLDDVRREHAADLGGALVAQAPVQPCQEAGPEGVTDAGGLDRR